MQKIKSITLRNFKYFFGKETDPAVDNIKDLKEIIFKDGHKLIDKLNA